MLMINLRHVQIIVKLLRCVQQVKHDCSCYSLHSLPRQTYSWLRQPKFGALTCPSEWIPQTQLIKPVAAILKLSLSLYLSFIFLWFLLFIFCFFACALMLPLATERKRRVVQIILYYYFFFFCINLISAAHYQHELAAISQRLRQSAKQTIEVG